jgi:hypothetical protein
MLNEFELKNLQTLKAMLEDFKNQKAAAEIELRGIDNKYKAIIENEKKELKDKLAAAKKEIDFWEKPIIKRYGKTIDELLANPDGAAESDEESADELPFEEETIVDEQVEETKDEPVEEEPEFDGAGFTAEDNVVPENVAEAAVESWPEEEEKAQPVDDDAWPDFPQEWK